MKKFSIRTSRLLAGAAVAAAALFAACTADTEDEPVAAVPLRFSVSMPESWNTPDATRSAADKALPTRAGETTPFTGDSFGVFAYVEGNESPYMDNVEVTVTGDGSCTFEDEKSYYLPNGKSVTFYAYSPYTEWTSASISYSVTNTTETGESLLIAGKTVSVTSGFDGKIALTFSHALSKVTFTVDDQTTNYAYTNPTFTLSNVITSGTLKPNVSRGTTSDPFWIWGDTTLTEFGKNDVGVYYMIPYDFSGDGESPKIIIYGTNIETNKADITAASKGDHIAKWEKNKTYTYEFQIK